MSLLKSSLESDTENIQKKRVKYAYLLKALQEVIIFDDSDQEGNIKLEANGRSQLQLSDGKILNINGYKYQTHEFTMNIKNLSFYRFLVKTLIEKNDGFQNIS